MRSIHRCLSVGWLLAASVSGPGMLFGQNVQGVPGTRTVTAATEAQVLRARCGLVTSQLKVLFPESQVRVYPEMDEIVVEGRCPSTVEAERIRLVVMCTLARNVSELHIVDDVNDWFERHLIDRIKIPQTQVMLDVTIYRLDAERLVEAGLDTSALLEEAAGAPGHKWSKQTGWVAGLISDQNAANIVTKLQQAEAATVQAAPRLTVISGQTASFLAGGEVPVPTIVRVGGGQKVQQTTSFKPFGTSLLIKPDVVDRNFIRLDITPEFSCLCPKPINGIPHVDARSIQTIATMKPGQVVAISGIDANLIEAESDRGVIRAVAGRVASAVRREKAEYADELLVLIRPEIVQPLKN